MKKSEVMARLSAEQDERGIQHWERLRPKSSRLKSYGIGLTRLRKIAREIGKDPALAAALWESDVYDARIVSLLIDDPKTITPAQAEAQVEQLEGGYLAHVFSSCDAPLAKAPFVAELAETWVKSKDPMRRRCGYGLLYEISKSTKKTAPDDAFFLGYVERIGKTFARETIPVKWAMGTALMGMGKRNRVLNQAALKVARTIGPIEPSEEDGGCEPFDVVKHLTSDYVKQKLGS